MNKKEREKIDMMPSHLLYIDISIYWTTTTQGLLRSITIHSVRFSIRILNFAKNQIATITIPYDTTPKPFNRRILFITIGWNDDNRWTNKSSGSVSFFRSLSLFLYVYLSFSHSLCNWSIYLVHFCSVSGSGRSLFFFPMVAAVVATV